MIKLVLMALCHLAAADVGVSNIDQPMHFGRDLNVLGNDEVRIRSIEFDDQFRLTLRVRRLVEDCPVFGDGQQENPVVMAYDLVRRDAQAVRVSVMGEGIVRPNDVGLLAAVELRRKAIKEAFVHKIAGVPNVKGRPTRNIKGDGVPDVLRLYLRARNDVVASDGNLGDRDAQFNPSAVLGNATFSRNFVGVFRPIKGEARKNNGYEEADVSGGGSPDTPLCPKCALFPSLSRAPLGAKIAFVTAFWLPAWYAIFEGVGVGLTLRRSINFKWLVGGIAIGLMPLFIGIV